MTVRNYKQHIYPFSYEKTEEDNYVRDSMTSAILNIDHAEFEAYKRNKQRVMKAQEVAAEVDFLKSEITILKTMLSEFINTHNKHQQDILSNG